VDRIGILCLDASAVNVNRIYHGGVAIIPQVFHNMNLFEIK